MYDNDGPTQPAQIGDVQVKSSDGIGRMYAIALTALAAGFVVCVIIGIFLIQTERHYRQLYINSGNVAYQNGDFSTALLDYQQYLKRYPRDADIHHGEAIILIRIGRLQEAHKELVSAMKDLPDTYKRSSSEYRQYLATEGQWHEELKALDVPKK